MMPPNPEQKTMLDRIAALRTEDGLEALALTILNSDRKKGGWPLVKSRAGISNSDGYVINAVAVIAHILGEA